MACRNCTSSPRTLSVLQNQGHHVALVTDGRMSGASGTVPAAIHVSPESICGGPMARVRDGDIIRLDARAGTLEVFVPADEFAARPLPPQPMAAQGGSGRDLFSTLPPRGHGCRIRRQDLQHMSKTDALRGIMKRAPVIPVIVVHDLSHAAPLAEALYEGGLTVLEVTLRTPVALEAISLMRKAVPGRHGGRGHTDSSCTVPSGRRCRRPVRRFARISRPRWPRRPQESTGPTCPA